MAKKRSSKAAKRAAKFLSMTRVRIVGRESEVDPETGVPTYEVQMKTPFGWTELGEQYRPMITRILSSPLNWLVVIAAEFEMPDGEPYERSAEFTVESVSLTQLNDAIRQQRAELLEGANMSHFRDVVYVSQSMTPRALAKYKAKADTADSVRELF